MNRQSNALAMAIAASLGAGAAQAAVTSVTLTEYLSYSNNGPSVANISSSTATWQYDDVTGVVTQTGGDFNARFNISPPTTLFRHTATDLVIGAGGAASASSWACVEGNFGGNVGANLCGNYSFGANFANESTVVYAGNTVTRTMGGDDAALGPPQSLADLNGMTATVNGTSLVLTNGSCTLSPAANCTTISGNPLYNKGLSLTFQLPLPPDAADDSATTHVNTPVAIDVLANDANLADPVTLSITTPPDHGGSVAITDNGAAASQACADPCTAPAADIRVTLTPSAIVNTASYSESFGYTVTDASTQSDGATVSVAVNNTLPVANNGSLAIPASGGPQAIDVSAIAGNVMGDAAVTITATNGTLGTTSVAGSTITYTLTGAQAGGSDSFNYTLTDADGDTDSGSISVTIAAPNPPFSATGLRQDDGGSALDWAVLSLFGAGALVRRRRRGG
ncbi:hypothetical protein FBQ88_12810 [Gammaproteobacteria bacterium PRO2]|nr:hypothetical protein [Gammaproteobacteria bacterium PRO8]MDL1881907.1 hypothetical protein [Gammaproteobacteria bacterium PRO2]